MTMQSDKEIKSDSRGVEEPKTILSGDTDRIKLLREVGELAHVPEIGEHVSKALSEAKQKFGNKISEYRNLKSKLEDELGEKIENGDKKSKSYFFEMTRVKDSGSDCKWELGDFKLNVKGKVLTMIFSKLIANLEDYQVAPDKIQVEDDYSPLLDKWFKIYFTKNREDRIVGFVKIIEDKFVIKENSSMLTVNTKSYFQKERALRLIEENADVSEDIYFYASLIGQQKNPLN